MDGAEAHDLRYMPQDTGMNAALTVYETIILALKQGVGGWRLSAGELRAVDDTVRRFNISHLPSPIWQTSNCQSCPAGSGRRFPLRRHW